MSCTVVVLSYFVMCGCLDNCVGVLVICVIVFTVFLYISNKMQRYTIYFFLETALHVSGGISTRRQEHTQLYLQHLVLVKP